MKTNDFRLGLAVKLERQAKKSKQRLWKDASEAIFASRKNRPSVNVREIARNSKEGSKILVPGKVLGLGSIDHKITIGAYSFSMEARKKIVSSGGTCLSIPDFIESTPSVNGVILLG